MNVIRISLSAMWPNFNHNIAVMSSSDLCMPKLIIPDFTLELRSVGETQFSRLSLPRTIDNWYWLITISTTAFHLCSFAHICVTMQSRIQWELIDQKCISSRRESGIHTLSYYDIGDYYVHGELCARNTQEWVVTLRWYSFTMIFISWITRNSLIQISSP